jgi:hypothetical protein
MDFTAYLQRVPSDRKVKVRPGRRRTHPPAREGAAIDERFTPSICLACGETLPPALARSASLRCHDCRDAGAPLRAELVEPPQELRPKRRLKLRPAA